MTFKEIKNIKREYQTLNDEVIATFYIPCLEHAINYKRAVGYFSSSILLDISKGLASLALRGGKMKLLVAPTLSKEDYDAISKGYDLREYATQKIIDSFDEFVDYEEREDRLGLLSYLIQHKILDVKIVFLKEKYDKSFYHEKLGIMEDEDGNKISFSGSSNETYQGFKGNYENIDVFKSWDSQDSNLRCHDKIERFERLWKCNEDGTVAIKFPDVIKDKILKYSISQERLEKIDKEVVEKYINEYKNTLTKKDEPTVKNIELRDYQNLAIENWVKQDYKGIFDMATGTGKTFTGCGAISKLYENEKRLFVWICCPFTHLVDQWSEEVKNFGIEPIVCYGNSSKYMTKLRRQVLKFKSERTNFVCVLITNAGFKEEKIQSLVQTNLEHSLLLVDEAHNFGSYQLSKCMKLDYPYRLALSATIERYGDKIGTQRLYDFFGAKCIEYTLEQAIVKKKLTPYKYYPVIVPLDFDELEEYRKLTQRIKQLMQFNQETDEIPPEVRSLLIRRARIVAGAKLKVDALKAELENYKHDNNLLVYCGAVKYGQEGYKNCEDEIKQIQAVSRMMTSQLGMKVCKFTSDETTEERKSIIESYKNGQIQSLVAIKCLDEGMNVPAIKTAFILASSTNPKEYIQRRGRVLRTAEGKQYAEIYDFITLPVSLERARKGLFISDYDLGLVKRELSRVIDFSNLSINPSYSNSVIDSIYQAFNLDIIQGEIDIYE